MDLKLLFNRLLEHFGKQNWWPADTSFEVIVGAILTQNTSWRNVERAISNLKQAGKLTPEGILSLSNEELEDLIRPAGFYRQKAERLKLMAMVDWAKVYSMPLKEAREYLLSLKGVGKETADSILLYALNKPIFVIDAYTKRIYHRLTGDKIDDYDQLRSIFEEQLSSVYEFNEMHALLVELAKNYCLKNNPKCSQCPVSDLCEFARR